MFGTFTINNSTVTFKDATKYKINNLTCNYIDELYVAMSIFRCKNYYLLFELQGFKQLDTQEPKTEEEFLEGLEKQENPYYFSSCHIFYDELRLTYNSSIEQCLWIANRYDREIRELLNEFERPAVSVYESIDNVWNFIKIDDKALVEKGLEQWEMVGIGILDKGG